MIVASSEFKNKATSRSKGRVKYKVKIYPTKLSAPSKGIPFSVDTTMSGSVPNLSFYWGGNPPFNADSGSNITFSGYFYAKQSGTLQFYLMGECGSVLLSCAGASFNGDLNADSQTGYFSSGGTVTAGNWYQFSLSLSYLQNIHTRGGIVVKYGIFSGAPSTNPNDYVILNAGVMNVSNSFETGFDLRVIDVEVIRRLNETSQATIKIPYHSSQYYRDVNYYGLIDQKNTANKIQINSYVEIYVGYEVGTQPSANETIGFYENGYEYIPIFVGNIKNIRIDRNGHTAILICRDFYSILETAINRNYPDLSSYWNFGYLTKGVPRQPDGENKPIAYDKFQINHCLEDLGIKAGIVAERFHGYKYEQNTSNQVVNRPSMFPNDFTLDFPDDYFEADENTQFSYRIGFGEKLINVFKKIIEIHGYFGYFNEIGDFVLEPQAAPLNIVGSDQMGTPTMSIKSYSGGYVSGGSAGGLMGRSIGVIVKRGPSETTFTVDVYSSDANGTQGTLLTSQTFDANYTKDWEFRDGIDPSTGSHPSIFKITNLPNGFDYYYVNVTGGNLDAILSYKDNINEPVYTLSTTSDISKLSYDFGASRIRNDVIVVGKRRGVWVGDKKKPLNEVDPDKPNWVYDNVYYRAIDLESIYDYTSDRWLGQDSTIVVQSPEIGSDDRAMQLATNILGALNRVTFETSPTVVGNIIPSIGDFIRINDVQGYYVDVLLNTITYNLNEKGLLIRYNTSPYLPVFSYIEPKNLSTGAPYANISVSDTSGYDRSFRIKNNIKVVSTGTDASGNDYITVDTEPEPEPPSSGILILDYGDGKWAKFSYSSYSAKTFSGLTMIDNNTNYYGLDVNAKVLMGYNPYEFEESQISKTAMQISFDVTRNAVVRVGIKEYNATQGTVAYIAGLTGGGGIENNKPALMRVYPGDTIKLIWDGIDQTGKTHNDPSLVELKDYYSDDGLYNVELEFTDLETGQVYTIFLDSAIAISKTSVPTYQISVAPVGSRSLSVFYVNDPVNGGVDLNPLFNFADPSQTDFEAFLCMNDEGGFYINITNYNMFQRSVKFFISTKFTDIYTEEGSDGALRSPHRESIPVQDAYPAGEDWTVLSKQNYQIDFKSGKFGSQDIFDGILVALNKMVSHKQNTTYFYQRFFHVDINIFDKSGRRAKIQFNADTKDFVVDNILYGLVFPGNGSDLSRYSYTVNNKNYSISISYTGFGRINNESVWSIGKQKVSELKLMGTTLLHVISYGLIEISQVV